MNEKLKILTLILVVLLYPAPAFSLGNIDRTGLFEQATALSSTGKNFTFHFQEKLPEIRNPDVNPIIIILWQMEFVGEIWKYSFFFILFFLILWFYRRYEIKRIKRHNAIHNQKVKPVSSSEKISSNRNLYSGKEELIDQCLTGNRDTRECFFYMNGNRIYIDDNFYTGPKPATVDMLLNKINAGKFCDRTCREQENNNFPASKFPAKSEINGKSNPLGSIACEYLVKPCTYSDGFYYSVGTYTNFTNTAFINPKDKSLSPPEREFILNAMKIIEANYTDYRFSVEQLARKSNMSVSQINRKLNSLTGFPAGRLVSKFRLHRASEFLINGAGSISDVCFSTGFNGLAYFSRVFKKEFGCTPSVFRQLMTKKSISVRK